MIASIAVTLWLVGTVVFSIYGYSTFFDEAFWSKFRKGEYLLCSFAVAFFIFIMFLWFVFLPCSFVLSLIDRLQAPRRARRAQEIIQQHVEAANRDYAEIERRKRAHKAFKYIASNMEGWMEFCKKETDANS